MNTKPVRILVTFLLFLVGVASLYSSLDRVLDVEEEPFSWMSLVSSLLLLFSAYGLLRGFSSARYTMYAYSAIALLVGGLVALYVVPVWQLIVPAAFALATTFYVHQYFRASDFQAPRRFSRSKEGGFILIYCALVFSCLFGASLTEEPEWKTLSGPVSVRK